MMKKMAALVFSMMLILSIIPNMPNAQAAPQFRNLATNSTYTWSEAPESNYPDPGNKLIDGKKEPLMLRIRHGLVILRKRRAKLLLILDSASQLPV
ncbi:hypothetical protein PAV_3c04320 [Paenibacillus alvei DSM 29]|uniref:hypothetical protein n=1 Tax=Paenibacillus alvei TaxID=44250 RepID=UPI00028856D1|nr:hypothetical protein [Paenibacillus alvei]EJW17982.1 hypothetical protein PAV_3c04320 [Paenibacillus alvei DSM 29]